jgi:hypothetical protein
VTKAINNDPIIVSWLREAGLSHFATFTQTGVDILDSAGLDWMDLNPKELIDRSPAFTSALLSSRSGELRKDIMPILALQTGLWPLGRGLVDVIEEVHRLKSIGHTRVGIAINYGCTEVDPPEGAKYFVELIEHVRAACPHASLYFSAGGSSLLSMTAGEIKDLARHLDEIRIGEALLLGTTPTGPATARLTSAFELRFEVVEICDKTKTISIDIGWLDCDTEDLARRIYPHQIVVVSQHNCVLRLHSQEPAPAAVIPDYKTLCRAYSSKNITVAYETA